MGRICNLPTVGGAKQGLVTLISGDFRCVAQHLPVYLAMLSSSSGYFVNLSISTGMMSFSCSRRHRRFLSAAWGTARQRKTDAAAVPTLVSWTDRVSADVLTCMKRENLWSFFFLLLMSSSADGMLLQKVPTALFIFSSSSPPNWKKQQTFVLQQIASFRLLAPSPLLIGLKIYSKKAYK